MSNVAGRVLVVDDERLNRMLLRRALEGEGHTVLEAPNGREALELLSAGPVDVVLLDIVMPGMDGYEVCRRLKADAATKHIPVILLTAKVEVEDAQLGFDAGCADYITKPVMPPLVVARVRTHVTLKLARDFLGTQRWM